MGGNPPPKGVVEKLTCTSVSERTVSLSNDNFSVSISGPQEDMTYFKLTKKYVVSLDEAPEE